MKILPAAVRRLFVQDKQASPVDAPLPQEAAWSESSIYNISQFPKYNPDALISRRGYDIYLKMMTDEQVKAVVRFKRDAITSREWEFSCDYDSLSEEECAARCALFTSILEQMERPFLDALNGIMSAMYNGFSMTEKVFMHIEHNGITWVGIKRLKVRPCDTFYFHVDEHGNITSVEQKFEHRSQQIDIDKFIHYVQNPDCDEHYGRSELREAYRSWFSKDMVIKFQNIHLERFAAGFVWAAPKDGKTIVQGSPEFTALKQVMSNLQATSSIILPSGIELHIEHPATTEAFEKAVAQHDKSIAKALLVPNLLGITEQGQHGSLSQANTQLEAFLWTLDADATRLEGAINTQLCKELGDYNFGDGMYPKFKFKPISDSNKLEIVKIWLSLVSGGAVQATAADEAYLREALEIPQKPEVAGTAPDLILSDAQTQSLISIITAVSAGTMSPEAAKALITSIYPLDDAQAAALVDKAKVEKPPIDPNAPQPQAMPPTQMPQPKLGPDGKPLPPETVVGKMGIAVSAFTRAIKRVDFAVLANKADYSSKDAAHEIAIVNSDVVKRLVKLVAEYNMGTAQGAPSDVQKIQFTASEMAALKSAITKGLKAAWGIGEAHARKELAKANGAAFAVNDMALQDVAAEYLKSKGYTMAGDISTATQKIIRNIVMEGVKTSKTSAEVEQEIWKALERDGLVTPESVANALGAPTIDSAYARIETAVRTTSFEAINEARYQMFSDPSLEGFVQALEYSAILDDRTTEICSQLNGQTYGIDDEVWATFRPPNHFNSIVGGVDIYTARGNVSIEDVRVGDEVMTHTGEISRVYAVMSKPNDTDSARELKLSSGGILRVTDEHPVLTLSGWKRADEVLIGDKVFQRIEQMAHVPLSGTAEITQTVLLDAHNRKAMVNEESVAYQIGSFTPGMSSAVQFKINAPVEHEVENVGTDGDLCFKLSTEQRGKARFVPAWLRSISFSTAASRLGSIFNETHRISALHAVGLLFGEFGRRFRILFAPMVAVCIPCSGRFTLRLNQNSMTFTESAQAISGNPIFFFNSENGFSKTPVLISNELIDKRESEHINSFGWLEATIISNDVFKYNGRVYNLAVKDAETYMAGNVLVHNCRSLLVAVTTQDGPWTPSSPPTVDPQKGFGFTHKGCQHG